MQPTTVAEIRDALASMNPAAREATELFATALLRNPETCQNEEGLDALCLQSCEQAIAEHGTNLEDRDAVHAFLEEHGLTVLRTAIAIVKYAAEQERTRRSSGGWRGKESALADASVLADLFDNPASISK